LTFPERMFCYRVTHPVAAGSYHILAYCQARHFINLSAMASPGRASASEKWDRLRIKRQGIDRTRAVYTFTYNQFCKPTTDTSYHL